MSAPKPLQVYLEELPRPEEIRRRIAENIRERQLLRQVLKLAEQRQAAQGATR